MQRVTKTVVKEESEVLSISKEEFQEVLAAECAVLLEGAMEADAPLRKAMFAITTVMKFSSALMDRLFGDEEENDKTEKEEN